MARSLHTLFDAIASARDERELRLAVMDTVEKYFGVQRSGIYLLNDPSPLAEVDVRSIPEACVERNPVLGYVVERHVPAHEGLVLPPEDWKQLCPRHDHEHVMTGPIVSGGRLVGTVNFARMSGTPAFNANDLADLSALCLHLSAKFATLQTQQTRFNSSLRSRLTPRELEIAELVAQGLTNVEIGAALWIQPNSVKQALKRMFRKLEVSTRAQLVAQLQDVLGSRPVT
ncbi:LuxR C-terminal-related transcriptional regulator [Allocoleopsis sp.]|uniref:LuxR C-terminal-related transcriptional regulator n=1 Tax=Allocoleopsis sp. TaxID=3088169 RepID=UPI002FD190CF